MKAIILAAGKGTRLRPVTLTTPKPLVPVANRSLIEYAIEMIKLGGMNEVGIVVNSLDSIVVKRIGDGASLGVNVSYIVQEEQLGLAHAVGLAKDFVGDDPFAMFLGDNIFQDKMGEVFRNFEASDAESVIALGEVNDPTRFGIGEVEGDRVINLEEKPQNPRSNLAIAGVYLFRPASIFDAISRISPSDRGELEITDALKELVKDGKLVKAHKLTGWWIDAGKPTPIIEANQLVMSDYPYTPPPETNGIQGDSQVSSHVSLGFNSKIIDSVVRGPVVIGNGVTIKNSYVGPYTSIGDNCTVENSEIEASIVMQNVVIRNVDGRIDSSLLAEGTVVESRKVHVPATHRFVLAENSYVQF